MSTEDNTTTEASSADQIQQLEQRVAELEAMTEVDSDSADGPSVHDLLDIGLTRRQALMAIALVGAGYSMGPAITKAITEPAAASHGGATLGTASNPLAEIHVEDLYQQTDNIDTDSLTTDDATINQSVTWPDGSTTTTSPGDGGSVSDHDNSAHTEAFVSDGDGTERQIWVIANGASDPSGAAPDDIIFEEEA